MTYIIIFRRNKESNLSKCWASLSSGTVTWDGDLSILKLVKKTIPKVDLLSTSEVRKLSEILVGQRLWAKELDIVK